MGVIGNMGSKVLMLEQNSMCVYTTYTSTRVGQGCPALRTGDGMASQLSPHIQCHRLSCKIYRLSGGLAILWLY